MERPTDHSKFGGVKCVLHGFCVLRAYIGRIVPTNAVDQRLVCQTMHLPLGVNIIVVFIGYATTLQAAVGRLSRGAPRARAAARTPGVAWASCRAAATATRQGVAVVRRRPWRKQGRALRSSTSGAVQPRSSAAVVARPARNAREAARPQSGDPRRRPPRRPRGWRAPTSAVASAASRARASPWPAP